MPILQQQPLREDYYTLKRAVWKSNTERYRLQNDSEKIPCKHRRKKINEIKREQKSYLSTSNSTKKSNLKLKQLKQQHVHPKQKIMNKKALNSPKQQYMINQEPAHNCPHLYTHNCSYIKIYLNCLSNRLSEQKHHKQIISLRQKELIRENRFMNDYFSLMQNRQKDKLASKQQQDNFIKKEHFILNSFPDSYKKIGLKNSKSLSKLKELSQNDGLYFSFKGNNLQDPSEKRRKQKKNSNTQLIGQCLNEEQKQKEKNNGQNVCHSFVTKASWCPHHKQSSTLQTSNLIESFYNEQ